MNQDFNYLQKPFMTIGAVFEDELPISEALRGEPLPQHHGYVYTFKAELDSGLKAGDFAVVHANDELKIVRVVEVHSSPDIQHDAQFQYKWVIQRIDFELYRERLKEERKLSRLLSRLAFAEKKNQLIERLKNVAEHDTKIAKFLRQYLARKE